MDNGKAKPMVYDAPRVTRDEATELVVYHLRMAAALFQLVPDDDNVSLLLEIERVCDEVEGAPARKWAREIWTIYDNMKGDDR